MLGTTLIVLSIAITANITARSNNPERFCLYRMTRVKQPKLMPQCTDKESCVWILLQPVSSHLLKITRLEEKLH